MKWNEMKWIQVFQCRIHTSPSSSTITLWSMNLLPPKPFSWSANMCSFLSMKTCVCLRKSSYSMTYLFISGACPFILHVFFNALSSGLIVELPSLQLALVHFHFSTWNLSILYIGCATSTRQQWTLLLHVMYLVVANSNYKYTESNITIVK